MKKENLTPEQQAALEKDTMRQRLADIRFTLYMNTRWPFQIKRWSAPARYVLAKSIKNIS